MQRPGYFNTYINYIFLYHCGLWTLISKVENQIEVFQQNLLRWVLNITNLTKILSSDMYKVTKQTPWSTVCRPQCLTLFGHRCHLEGVPAGNTLIDALKPIKRMVTGQHHTYFKIIKESRSQQNAGRSSIYSSPQTEF